jgi:hypothetical protein
LLFLKYSTNHHSLPKKISFLFYTCYVSKIVNFCILAGIAGSCVPLHDSAAPSRASPLVNTHSMPRIPRAASPVAFLLSSVVFIARRTCLKSLLSRMAVPDHVSKKVRHVSVFLFLLEHQSQDHLIPLKIHWRICRMPPRARRSALILVTLHLSLFSLHSTARHLRK